MIGHIAGLGLGIAVLVSAPVEVTTSPAGAKVTLAYERRGEAVTLHCVAPCALRVPAGSGFSIVAELPGHEQQPLPPLEWRQGLFGLTLAPIHIELKALDDR